MIAGTLKRTAAILAWIDGTLAFRLILVIAGSLPVSCVGQEARLPAKVSDRNWVEHVSPGVRLIGQPNIGAAYLDGRTFTMTPDGKVLVGSRGRRLYVIDWDSQQLIREVELPTRAGSSWVDRIEFTTNGKYMLVWVSWSGRPYDANDDTDLDDEFYFRSDPEFPSDSFYGMRLMVYDANYSLLHNIEVQTELADQKTGTAPVRTQIYNLHVVPDHDLAVVVASPQSKIIDVRHGEIVGYQDFSQGVWVSDRMLGSTFQTGKREWIWWDIESNRTSPATELEMPTNAMLIRTAQAGDCFAYVDRKSAELIVRSRDSKTNAIVPGMTMLNSWAGTFSADGRYYVFPLDRFNRTTLILVDLSNEKIQFQFDYPDSIDNFFFRPKHTTLMCRAGNRVIEVAIDDEFEANMLAIANSLPTSGKLTFADNNRFLSIGNGRHLLNLSNGTSHRNGNRDFAWQACSPTANQAIWDHNNGLVQQIEIGRLDCSNKRLFYANIPSPNPGVLQFVLGLYEDLEDLIDQSIGIYSTHFSFSPDGEILRNIYIDNKKLRLRRTLVSSRALLEDRPLESSLFDSHMTVSPDGRRVAIVQGQVVEILDANTGERMREISLPVRGWQVELDRRGEYAAVKLSQGPSVSIAVFRTADGQEVLNEPCSALLGFGFRPGKDQFYLATGKSENRVRFFDRETWDVDWEHATDHSPGYGMAISSDGTEVAIGLRDARIEIWKLSELPR